MRLLIYVVIALMVIGLTESVQLGGNTENPILLGSLTKNAASQFNASNETNTTNQTNVTQNDVVIPIKNPMSTIPVSNKYQKVDAPNSIQSNSITYRFTT